MFQVDIFMASGCFYACRYRLYLFGYYANRRGIHWNGGCYRKKRLSLYPQFDDKENGKIIDGHSIHEAIKMIDDSTNKKPLCYMTNCIHPKVLKQALQANDTMLVRNRFKGIQANAAYLSPEELD